MGGGRAVRWAMLGGSRTRGGGGLGGGGAGIVDGSGQLQEWEWEASEEAVALDQTRGNEAGTREKTIRLEVKQVSWKTSWR